MIKGGPVERWEAIEPEDEDPVGEKEIEFIFLYSEIDCSEGSNLFLSGRKADNGVTISFIGLFGR